MHRRVLSADKGVSPVTFVDDDQKTSIITFSVSKSFLLLTFGIGFIIIYTTSNNGYSIKYTNLRGRGSEDKNNNPLQKAQSFDHDHKEIDGLDADPYPYGIDHPDPYDVVLEEIMLAKEAHRSKPPPPPHPQIPAPPPPPPPPIDFLDINNIPKEPHPKKTIIIATIIAIIIAPKLEASSSPWTRSPPTPPTRPSAGRQAS